MHFARAWHSQSLIYIGFLSIILIICSLDFEVFKEYLYETGKSNYWFYFFFLRKCVFKFKLEIKGLKLIYIYTDMIL